MCIRDRYVTSGGLTLEYKRLTPVVPVDWQLCMTDGIEHLLDTTDIPLKKKAMITTLNSKMNEDCPTGGGYQLNVAT